jgi:glyoxylase-like metal-dependent hydrolase (beta-lactamase superfamily II)
MNYPKKLTERVFLLGNHYISIYHVRGDRFSILIEAGLSSTAAQVIQQLNELSVKPESLNKLFVTHAHADHVTGAAPLKRALPWMTITAGEKTKDLLSKEKIQQFFFSEDQYTSSRLAELGAVAERNLVDDPFVCEVEEVVRPGQTLDLGGIQLEIMDAPGHCLGGLALWEPKEKMLFCSDYLGFCLPPDQFVSNFYVDYDEFRTTFENLSRLDPQWICPGHCNVYKGEEAAHFLQGSRKELEWVLDYVASHAQSQETHREVKEDFFNRYFTGESTIFSPENTRYCMDLLVRRILDSKAFARL